MKRVLQDLEKEWMDCKRCDLHKTRNKLVFGSGSPEADILILGEAPGEKEDKKGLPFWGPSGEILDVFIDSMQLNRSELYITNTVCCRPTHTSIESQTGMSITEDRIPSRIEREACKPRLLETIYLVDPMIIIAVGKVAHQVLLGRSEKMSFMNGRMETAHLQGQYVDIRYPVFTMYHTAFLSRSTDRIRENSIWAKTMGDWVRICNVVDHLREVYYGIPRIDRQGWIDEKEKSKRKRRKRN